MESSENTFITERLPLAIFLHASQRLRFSHCDLVDEGKVQFVFADPGNEGDQAELEFENGAVVAANSLFASQKYLRRKMTESLNNNRKNGESDHGKPDHNFRLDESLPKWHGWYALRRGVGTAVADLSNSLAAKGLLRHSSVSTTERQYIKDVPESTLHAMRLLETLCNPRATTGEAKPN